MGTGRVQGHMAHRTGACAHIGTIMVPEHIWAPEWCLDKYRHRKGARAHMETVPGHHSGDNICLGTFPVPICARAPLRCTYVPGHLSGVLMCPGTLPVPIRRRAPFRFPYVLVHPSGAYIYPSTILVPICSRAPFRCPYVLGHHSGANMCLGTLPVPIRRRAPFHMGTGMVPGQLWAPEGCPGTYRHWMGARKHMGTKMEHRKI